MNCPACIEHRRHASDELKQHHCQSRADLVIQRNLDVHSLLVRIRVHFGKDENYNWKFDAMLPENLRAEWVDELGDMVQ